MNISEEPTAGVINSIPQTLETPTDREGPVLTILYHPDFSRIGERACLPDLTRGGHVPLAQANTFFRGCGAEPGRPLDDASVGKHPLFLTHEEEGSLLVIPTDSRVHVDGRLLCCPLRVPRGQLSQGVVLELDERIVLLLHIGSFGQPKPATKGLIGNSSGLNLVREDMGRLEDLMVPVLIRGESGTGKELVATAIHERSPRAARPFVSVNMGAIPRELAVSELFGAERGAFTGAVQRREGLFAKAHGGTLFLDEIGEAPPEVQVALLRVLETREVVPIGASRPQKVDVRLLAATDADLETKLEQGSFRLPLLHRLNGYEIKIPPLRERREDLGLLLCRFLRKALHEIGEIDRLGTADPLARTWFPPALVARMARYAWPGNVRELQNLVRKLVIANRGREAFFVHPTIDALLPPARPASVSETMREQAPSPHPVGRKSLEEIGVEELRRVMAGKNWDIAQTARHFGYSRPAIYGLMRRHGLRGTRDICDAEIAHCYRAHDGPIEALAAELCVSVRSLRRRLTEMTRRGTL